MGQVGNMARAGIRSAYFASIPTGLLMVFKACCPAYHFSIAEHRGICRAVEMFLHKAHGGKGNINNRCEHNQAPYRKEY